MKTKLYPKCKDSPTAVFDKHDHLVTDPEGIKDVINEEFKYRLRDREIENDFQDLK